MNLCYNKPMFNVVGDSRMAHHFTPTPNKTYATKANAIKAVEKLYGENQGFADTDLRYVIMVDDAGRFYPVFFGMGAVERGVFHHFCVVA